MPKAVYHINSCEIHTEGSYVQLSFDTTFLRLRKPDPIRTK